MEEQAITTMAQAEYTRDQIELVKRTVAKGATDDEFRLFMYTAQRAGLDPLLGQVYFVKRKNKKQRSDGTEYWEEVGQTLFGRDAYRIVATRSGKLDGIEVTPNFGTSGNIPISATAQVWRKDASRPFTVTAMYSEYNDARSWLWKGKPVTMICKVAEAQALRMAFPDLLVGSYTPEEFGATEAPQVIEGEVVAETPRPEPPPTVGPSGERVEVQSEKAIIWKTFWPTVRERYGLSNAEVHTFCQVDTMKNFKGSPEDAYAMIEAGIAKSEAERLAATVGGKVAA